MGKKRRGKAHDGADPPGKPRPSKSGEEKPVGTPAGDQDDHFNQIPFRLREIIKSKELMKKGKPKAKKIKAAIPLATTEESLIEEIAVPHFKRKKDESKRAYLGRMNTETDHVMFLTKNQVERKPELEEETKEKPAAKVKSEKKMEYNQSRLNRLHQKKLNRQEKEMEKNMFIDKVKFGEVAMEPPTFTAQPRKAPAAKNAVSKGLLLNSLLGQDVVSTASPSMARKRIMEEERVRVVEAYRHLKRQKQRKQELRDASLKTLKNL
ncbi:coiled-coil domain-containing protein 137 [Gadus macrocephalus]|uniref:coiled-coil domain-containing protein 137 n=1 Tax=Gadus macrocephalus TaxID=80720 RepID=UPI0028CB3ED0|nr:coiled-coil domain-containing protein 137 [Gadus macrocephalus]